MKQIVTIITHMVVVIKPTIAMIETIKPDGSHHCLQTRKQVLKFVKWVETIITDMLLVIISLLEISR